MTLADAVQAKIGVLRAETRLWHYTNPAALRGILTPQPYKHLWSAPQTRAPGTERNCLCVWANSVRFMNDHSEFRMTIDRVSSALRERRLVHGQGGDQSGGLPVQCIDFLLKSLATFDESNMVFVASFSESKNDLSQWRAYAGGTGGYALGIHARELIDLAKQDGGRFIVRPCIYDKDIRDAEIDAFVAKSLKFELSQLQDHKVISSLLSELSIMAATFKDPGFEVEKEWRIIHSAVRQTTDKLEWTAMHYYRETAMGIAPYVKFPLQRPDQAVPPNLEIMVGPSLEPMAVTVAMREYVANLGYARYVDVTTSGTPLRPV